MSSDQGKQGPVVGDVDESAWEDFVGGLVGDELDDEPDAELGDEPGDGSELAEDLPDEMREESDSFSGDAQGAAPAGFERRRGWSRETLLRALLVLNVVLLLTMLALPSAPPKSEEVEPAPAQPPTADPTADPPSALQPLERPTQPAQEYVKPPLRIGTVKRSELWDRAVLLAGKGEYGDAVHALQEYLRSETGMSDPVRRLVYNQLAFYLVKDGRLEEAIDYERMSNQLMLRSHLPEDLLRSARKAEEQHDLKAMRAAYSRFLLQQKQVPPSLRHSIAEAYLKIGDSYRIEATRGARQAEEKDRLRIPEGSSHR